MLHTCMEAFDAGGEVHGALECEDGEGAGEPGAEVRDGGGGERTACAVGED